MSTPKLIGISATKAFIKHQTGIERYVANIIKNILAIDSRHQYVLYLDPKEGEIQSKNESRLFSYLSKKKNYTVKKLNCPFSFGWTQLRLSAEMFKNPPDILFIPSHLPPLYCPKKTIITIHDVAFKKFPEVYSKKELYLQKIGIARVIKKAWRIIAPSEFTKNEIKKYYPRAREDNIFTVPHGYNQDIFYQTNELDQPAVKPGLVSIGRLENKKNIVNLIKAFNIIKNRGRVKSLKLTLIGAPGFGYQEIKQEIVKSKYKNDILELGWQTDKQIANYLRSAECFVFPSLYEGFGLPILEAMACACPIAGSKLEVFKEIGQNAMLYFNPFDPADMTKTIEQIIVNKNLQESLARKGLVIVKNYSWLKTARRTVELFG